MSGLIVLGMVAIWLIVLVPMWLNRHDAASSSRSMDTFSTAMRVLSRRPPVRGDRRYVVMPHREDWGVTVDNQPNISARPTSKVSRFSRVSGSSRVSGGGAVSGGPQVSRGRADLITRRRRVALVLLALVLLTAGLGVAGVTPWWLNGLADALVLAYVVHLRGQAVRAREVAERRLARAARAVPSRAALPDDLAVDRAFDYRRSASRSHGIEASIGATYGDQVPVSPSGTENGSRWEPVPVPLPTYVSKPVVQRPAARVNVTASEIPVVDLTKPGAWSEEQVDVRHLLLDETGSGTISASDGAASSRSGRVPVRPVATAEDEELDLILNRRRAVGD